MTRFVTQHEPLISLSDHRTSSHAREHEDQARRTQLRRPVTSVPLTGTGVDKLYTSCSDSVENTREYSSGALCPWVHNPRDMHQPIRLINVSSVLNFLRQSAVSLSGREQRG